MALSLAHDRNLSYERQDLERFAGLYHQGPDGIFLKRGKTLRISVRAPFPFVHLNTATEPRADRLYYGKAFVYPLVAAPFVWVVRAQRDVDPPRAPAGRGRRLRVLVPRCAVSSGCSRRLRIGVSRRGGAPGVRRLPDAGDLQRRAGLRGLLSLAVQGGAARFASLRRSVDRCGGGGPSGARHLFEARAQRFSGGPARAVFLVAARVAPRPGRRRTRGSRRDAVLRTDGRDLGRVQLPGRRPQNHHGHTGSGAARLSLRRARLHMGTLPKPGCHRRIGGARGAHTSTGAALVRAQPRVFRVRPALRIPAGTTFPGSWRSACGSSRARAGTPGAS